MIESYVEQGLIFKADTIEELAEKLGIPADNLKATVERYNDCLLYTSCRKFTFLIRKQKKQSFKQEAGRPLSLSF